MVNTDSLKAKQITQTHAIAWEDAHYRIHSLLRSECNVDFRRVKKKNGSCTKCAKVQECFYLSLSHDFWKAWSLDVACCLVGRGAFSLQVKRYLVAHWRQGRHLYSCNYNKSQCLCEKGRHIRENSFVVLPTHFHIKNKRKGVKKKKKKKVGFYCCSGVTRGQQISTFLTLAPENLIAAITW